MGKGRAASREDVLLSRVERWLGRGSARVRVGVGDDGAVLAAPRGHQVLTTDMLVEGTHFLGGAAADWVAVGRKTIAVNVSDLAAMGARPAWALLSLGLPQSFPDGAFAQLYRGFRKEAGTWGLDLIGGDLVRAPQVVINVAAGGEAVRAGAVRGLRSAARPGQDVYVTGALGGSAAGLALLTGAAGAGEAPWTRRLIARHRTPVPRVAAGVAYCKDLGDGALIDVSDSLWSEAHRLAARSGVRVELALADVPLFPGVERWAREAGRDARMTALFSGEEYELLFTTAQQAARVQQTVGRQVAVTRIGRVVRGRGVALLDAQGSEIRGLEDDTFRHWA